MLHARTPHAQTARRSRAGAKPSQQRGWKEYHRGTEITTNVLPKMEVKIVVEDDKVEEVIELITSIARTGEVGDGKIFIVDIADCIRIRTGDRGNSAL